MTGPELRDHRIHRELSQSELAALMDISPSTVSRWEKGLRKIGPLAAAAIAAALEKVDVTEFGRAGR